MKTGQNVYLQMPAPEIVFESGGPRPLHRALVVGAGTDRFTIAVEDPNLVFRPGLELLVLYNQLREFVQQPVRVEQVDSSAASCIVDLEPLGDSACAEQRLSFRVSAIGADVSAEVGVELDSRLQDVSATGFSIATTEFYGMGEMLPVKLSFEGRIYEGEVSVQNSRKLWGHRIRYGLQCAAGGDLREGLGWVSSQLQRAYLQRMRGDG